MRCYLAVDIGASSGRHIVGWVADGGIQTREVYRFPNGVQEQNGHLIWDVDALVYHVKQGIAAAKAQANLSSLAVRLLMISRMIAHLIFSYKPQVPDSLRFFHRCTPE